MLISNVHKPESNVELNQQEKQRQQPRKKNLHLIKRFWKIFIVLVSFNYFLTNQLLQKNIHAFGIDQQQQQPNVPHKLLSLPTVTPQMQTNDDFYENINDNQQQPNNRADNDDGDDDNNEVYNRPEEIQKAVCTVTAGEVRASAEAVTTKQLKGVCGSAELHLALNNLETKIYNELYALRSLLLQHLQQQQQQQQQTPKETIKTTTSRIVDDTGGLNNHEKQKSTSNQPKLITAIAQTPKETTTTSTAAPTTVESVELNRNNMKIPQLKSLNLNHFHQNIYNNNNNSNDKKRQQQEPQQTNNDKEKLQREDEVDKFNNTLLADRDIKLFTYYWKLENFTSHIESAKMEQIESPIFSIKGKPLQIKAYFQHMQRDFLYLQLQYATKSKTKNFNKNENNIMMEMGMASGAVNGGRLFKEIISNNKILFKHKISILDQHNQHSKDLVSQEFNNLDNGFLVPNSALLGSSPYIKQHALLIQLYLYL